MRRAVAIRLLTKSFISITKSQIPNSLCRYVYGSGRATSGSDTFVTKGRYAVADLSSGPSQFGNSQAGEGAVMALSIPRTYADEWQKPGQVSTTPRNSKLQTLNPRP